jgi:sugar lactone lactonase YvrE
MLPPVRRALFLISSAFMTALLLGPGATAAEAAPDCKGEAPKPRFLLRDQGTLESVIVGSGGRLFFTNESAVFRLDRPDGTPKLLAAVDAPGGLAFDSDGSLIVGYGNSIPNGTVGDLTGPSGLVRIDPDTGAASVFATGLSMANGLVRGPDGAFYASNDFGSNIDRITGGVTERGWAKVLSGNGLVIDSTGTYLFAAQTFQPPAIQRVTIANPSQVVPYAQDFQQLAAGLDGLAIDAAGRIFAAANGAGEIWRADTNGQFCAVLRGLPAFPDGPSAVAIGERQTDFPARNLYSVAFNGDLIELPGAAALPGSRPPKIQLKVRPRRAGPGRTEFRFRTRIGKRGRRQPVAGALVRFAGERARTDERGRARIEAVFKRRGRYRARASRADLRPDRAFVRAR